MQSFFETDWGTLFRPQMSLPEILVRGTSVYLSLCVLLRVVLKRQAGRVSLSDLLVISIVAGICRNPLVRDAYSVTDGLLVVATVLGISYAIDWVSFHVPSVNRLLNPPALPLIQNGQIVAENLRHELLTASQLGSKLRRAGVNSPAEVDQAFMEGDGQVTVIPKKIRPANCGGLSASDELPVQGGETYGNKSDWRGSVVDLSGSITWLRDSLAWHKQQATVLEEILTRGICDMVPRPQPGDGLGKSKRQS